MDVWRGIGSGIEVAGTLARLAHVHRATGDPAAAASCDAEYRALMDALGFGEAGPYLPPPYRPWGGGFRRAAPTT